MIETTGLGPRGGEMPDAPEPGGRPLDELTPGVHRAAEAGAAALAALDGRRAEVRGRRFDTIAVHGIYGAAEALGSAGAINEPITLASAQHFADADAMEAALAYLAPAWVYGRIASPTLGWLEETLALLETYGTGLTASATATSSGMAAIAMATQPFLVDAGPGTAPPNIVASARCYGGTFMLFSRYAAERGVGVRWVREPLDPAAWAGAVDAGTRFVFGEMPSNPGCAVFDIPAVAAIAHEAGVPLIVDPTVATPALLRPLGMGADVAVHSLSKTIGGSGLAIGGAIVARHGIPSRVGPDDLREDFALHVKLSPLRDHGSGLSAFSAFVILNDLRTLRSRVDQWSRNAARVARALAEHPAVAAVDYPGLASHPGYRIATRDLWLVDGDLEGKPANRYGSLMSFRVRGGHRAARAAFDRLRLIWRATDLGRVKTIATIPTISTHQQQGEAGRDLAAIPDDLIRLSVGGEHPDDVIADLDQALEAAR